jgi:hypothetical protein
LQSHIAKVDEKIERLMQAYLDKAIPLDEYKVTKGGLVQQKQQLKDQIRTFQASHETWLEPAIRFVKASKSAAFLAESGTDEEKRDFFKKAGSNRTISDRHLSADPREAWKLVVDQGHFAQRTTAPSCDGAALVGETNHPLQQAESIGQYSNLFQGQPDVEVMVFGYPLGYPL